MHNSSNNTTSTSGLRNGSRKRRFETTDDSTNDNGGGTRSKNVAPREVPLTTNHRDMKEKLAIIATVPDPEKRSQDLKAMIQQRDGRLALLEASFSAKMREMRDAGFTSHLRRDTALYLSFRMQVCEPVRLLLEEEEAAVEGQEVVLVAASSVSAPVTNASTALPPANSIVPQQQVHKHYGTLGGEMVVKTPTTAAIATSTTSGFANRNMANDATWISPLAGSITPGIAPFTVAHSSDFIAAPTATATVDDVDGWKTVKEFSKVKYWIYEHKKDGNPNTSAPTTVRVPYPACALRLQEKHDTKSHRMVLRENNEIGRVRLSLSLVQGMTFDQPGGPEKRFLSFMSMRDQTRGMEHFLFKSGTQDEYKELMTAFTEIMRE